VDIGVLHPDRPGNYSVGVECDGATYHSSKSARDRDRLRQEVLEALNWQIHRVWSTDWYRDPEREFARLVQKIEALRTIQV
jgi:very-short-patch-repair endonuclease